MTVGEKTKLINNKMEQNKAQDNLNGETAKISALSSGNASKYEFLFGKDVLPKKDLFEKAANMKKIKYSHWVKVSKAETDLAKKQYQELNMFFKFH